MLERLFCIAPMMEWTDRHCRYFHRLLTRRALLYTEMLSTGAVLFGDRARLLGFDPVEHPVAVQLGGSDPKALGEAARICADLGYDEINLNVGCPSSQALRACTINASTPAAFTAAAKASSAASGSWSSMPRRHLTVTGTATPAFMAATHSATSRGAAIRQAPKRPRSTRLDGQPTLRLISS